MSVNPFSNFDATYIASLNNSYRDAQVRSSGRTQLPEGKYQCMIDYVALKPSQYYADEMQLILGFEVISGDQKGVRVNKYINIIPERMDQLKTDLSILGVDLGDDIVNLGEQETIEAILDQIVDITVKHKARENGKGFFMNIFLNRSHGKAAATMQEVEDDDNPFDM